jgi:uncharacterized membrane protein
MNYAYCTNSHWYGVWPFGFFIFIAVFFIVGRFFWWNSRYHPYGYGRGGMDPLHIAKVRYAAGKITKDEYDKIKKDLGES